MGSETAILGDDAMTGSKPWVWVSVESMTDTAGVSGTQCPGNVSIGGDITLGDLAGEGIDLREKFHIIFEVRHTPKCKSGSIFLLKNLPRTRASRAPLFLRIVCCDFTSIRSVIFS